MLFYKLLRRERERERKRFKKAEGENNNFKVKWDILFNKSNKADIILRSIFIQIFHKYFKIRRPSEIRWIYLIRETRDNNKVD